jgi:hypothetical protein
LRKGERFAWTPQCEEAFQKLKEFLASPPILTRPKPGEQCFKIQVLTPWRDYESAMLKNTNLKRLGAVTPQILFKRREIK